MHYINSMLSSFENMTDFIKILCAVLLNDLFHNLFELANFPIAWQSRNIPLHLKVKPDYGMYVVTDGIVLDSYRDKPDKHSHIRFIRQYPLGSFFERADTPFHEWDIVQLWDYIDTVLKVQQSISLCVTTERRFEDKSDFCKYHVLSFAGVIVWDGVPDHVDVCRGRRRNNIPI